MGLEEQLAFCAVAPLGDRPPAVQRALLTELCRGPEGVLDRVEGDARLLAVLVERITTASGAAILEPMAATVGASPPALARLLAGAIDAAEALIQGTRPLELPLPSPLAALEPTLTARGFRLSHVVYDMGTAPRHPPPARPPLPDGLRWEVVSEARLDALHQVTRAAFAGRPDVAFPALDDWKAMTRAAPIPPRLLLHAQQVVGFASVGLLRPGLGQVRNIGRDPAWYGLRLGPILLAEAMHLLAEAGAERFTLSVLATNAAALRLYQDAGFEIEREERVFFRG